MVNLEEGLQLLISIAIPLSGGFAGAIFTASEVKGWYNTLKRPWWNPPNWLFGPMWTFLYISMGVASWLVYRQGGFTAQRIPLLYYASTLVFNFAWTPLFFKLHWVDLALLDMILLVIGEVLTAIEYSHVIGTPLTLLLLGPLLVWTTYATALTANIYINNPQVRAPSRLQNQRPDDDKIE